MKKKRVFGLMTAAGCALFTASAMGAVSDSFESESAGAAVTSLTGWDGYGTVTATNYTAAGDSSVGRPIVQASSNPANVLAIEGRATRTATTTANNAATVDMMVQVALPDDGLAFPANTTTENIQIAVGVDTNAVANKGELKVYCKNRSNVVGWYSLGAVLDKDSWHRVSFTFDYANQLCQIRVDGDPAITANGILNASSELAGAWYKLATSTTKTALAEVQIIGSTSIDDMLVSEAATVDDALPVLNDLDGTTAAGSSSVAVKNDWIEQQGITRAAVEDDAAAPDGTGMKISEKYAAGYDVDDGKKFELKDMDLSGANAVIKFNEANIPSTYKYVIEASADPTFPAGSTSTTDVTDASSGQANAAMGDGNVKYYRIKVTTR